MAKEFEQSVNASNSAPEAAEDGNYSKVRYGGQRQGDEDTTDRYIEPGEEGANAVRFQVKQGGIGSHEKGSSTSA